jgi:hypothetical protein
VADDHGGRAGIAQHLGGKVAGEGTGRLGVAVLGTDCQPGPRRDRREPGNQGRGRTDHQVDLGETGGPMRHLAKLGDRGSKAVHLPVPGYQRPALRRRHAVSP